MINTNLPKFFNYKEENSDNGYETIQDFYLSWALRCSQEQYGSQDNLVHQISKKITCKLLNINDPKRIAIKSVKTRRQWNHIDLVAEILAVIDGKEKKYALNIENKWYTSIRDNQLEKNKANFNSYYNENDWVKFNYVIFCDYEKIDDLTNENAEKSKYTILTICDLQNEIGTIKSTGNTLFDEYWFWNYPIQ